MQRAIKECQKTYQEVLEIDLHLDLAHLIVNLVHLEESLGQQVVKIQKMLKELLKIKYQLIDNIN